MNVACPPQALTGCWLRQAYHAGILGTLLFQSANETITAYDVTVAELLQDIANLENKADGVPDAQGIVTNYNGQDLANLVRLTATL